MKPETADKKPEEMSFDEAMDRLINACADMDELLNMKPGTHLKESISGIEKKYRANVVGVSEEPK